jgi:murein DD-endopeptidase MepM/ murein hydrolase activator NlpD
MAAKTCFLGLVLGLLASAVVSASPVTLSGEAIQGGMLMGTTAPGSTVLQDGEAVRVSPDGEFLLGFTRDAPATSEIAVELPGGASFRQQVQVAQRDYEIQRIDGLPERKVTPRSAEDLARIRADNAAVARARSLDDGRLDWRSGFIWPVTGRISGVYGSQRVLNGEPRRPHFGVDVAAPVGTPVHAPAGGIVTLAVPDMFFSGGTLILDHGYALTSTFLHLERILVEEGDRIEQGDVIAEVGATGRVTGPHLDWRMNLRGHRIDPQLLVPPMRMAE